MIQDPWITTYRSGVTFTPQVYQIHLPSPAIPERASRKCFVDLDVSLGVNLMSALLKTAKLANYRTRWACTGRTYSKYWNFPGQLKDAEAFAESFEVIPSSWTSLYLVAPSLQSDSWLAVNVQWFLERNWWNIGKDSTTRAQSLNSDTVEVVSGTSPGSESS